MENNDFKNVHKLSALAGSWKITPNQLESKVTIMCNIISELLSLQMPLASQKKSRLNSLLSAFYSLNTCSFQSYLVSP